LALTAILAGHRVVIVPRGFFPGLFPAMRLFRMRPKFHSGIYFCDSLIFWCDIGIVMIHYSRYINGFMA